MRDTFRRVAQLVSRALGTPAAFLIAVATVLLWAVTGPAFHYSDTWQLAINTGTTIVTFLMVFLIQNTQNRDATVVHLKLDELIRAVREARTELVDIEDLSEEQLERLRQQFAHMRRNAEARRGNPAAAGSSAGEPT
jgi:low affinity Fe/Cu permease